MAKVYNKVCVTVTKLNVLGVVEGISVMLAQHNGGSPTFEELWASESESPKLDIYYREALNDLETQLRKFSSSNITDFVLDVSAQDVTISFKPVSYWDSRLQNLLSNKVKEFLVHSIIGGWLSDFPEFAHPDYLSLAADDIQAINDILLERKFGFKGDKRADDNKTKDDASSNRDTEKRISDEEKPFVLGFKGDKRADDNKTKDDASSNRDTEKRISDEEKPFVQDKLAEYRHLDLTKVKTSDENMRGMERNEDNACNCFCREWVDFSNDLM